MISWLDGFILTIFAIFTYWFFYSPSKEEEFDALSFASDSLSRTAKKYKIFSGSAEFLVGEQAW